MGLWWYSIRKNEAGDIPNANTILIDRADRFGMADLYQLRGRVGRSNRRAYAYLLIPSDETLTQIARRRLAAIREFSELGAGFRIAALDLELRGAGLIRGRTPVTGRDVTVTVSPCVSTRRVN
jgi:transcription-repair coupling factor (superfamily II helicase)